MPHLLTGIEWLDRLHLHGTTVRKSSHVTEGDDSTEKTAPSEPKPGAETSLKTGSE